MLASQQYDLVIVDEAHHLKNRATVNWQLVNTLQKRFVLLLSATPVQNSLVELYNLLTLLKPGIFKTEKAFRASYMTSGKPRLPANRERMRGYQRAFAEFPGIQVLGSGIGNYQQPDARRVMEKFLTEHKEIDAVLSANDSMALGVLEALKATNRTAIVIGINGILPAVKQIETGGMLATVDFNMFKIGCTAARAAVRYLKKEPLPEKVILPAEVIDKTNYKTWLVPVDQRTCPEWSDVAR